MNKKIGIIIVILSILLIGGGIFFYFQKETPKEDENNYEVNRTSTTNTSSAENQDNNTSNSKSENASSEKNENLTENKNTPPPKTEEQIATFTTKIYSTDSARQNNISITCHTLNGTIVKNGETFSFCGTVGQSSTSKGYQKADIFDKNGNKKKGLGGGNCQISSTLYNAVLSVPTLVVTERHAHSNYVPYIEKGKDAATAYGSYDFKFRNDSGNDIKILASTDSTTVTTTLLSLK